MFRDVKQIDCHVHTAYSGHGVGTVEQVAQAAYEAGIGVLAFTEHLTMPVGVDPNNDFSMSESSSACYREEVFAAREEYAERGLDIIYGAEADWYADEAFLLEATRGYEYVLGSVHFIDGWAFDNPAYLEGWDERGIDAVWTRYFEIWCDAVRSKVPFTCMSHPDLPKKFGFRPSFDTRELFEQVAQVAASAGVMVEVNTAGLRKPVGELYPSRELLTAFCNAGVDCTIGSDAHDPREVGLGYAQALAALREAGYQRVTIPLQNGDRAYISLKGV